MTFLPVFLEALGVVLLILIFLWMKQTAFMSFANVSYKQEQVETCQIIIEGNEKIGKVSKELEKLGVVADKRYIKIRYYCSDFKEYEFVKGVHDVSANMGTDDLLNELTGKNR
ncbi:MAG: hypothetical protein MJ087_03005 [Lachnospiraceae bacterium]|nr:hypothetical protein [Lachnospiraceae bacterium]